MRCSLALLLFAFLAATINSAAQERAGPEGSGARTALAPPRKTKPSQAAPKRERLVLPTHEMQFSRIGASEVWTNRKYRDSVLAQPRLFWLGMGGLLYRKRYSDTVFCRIEFERPPNPYQNGGGNISLLYQDLNCDGSPEVLVGFWRNGGGTMRQDWVGINLIDVGGRPRLLLSAIIENEGGGWTPDPDNPENELFVTYGWERSVKLGGVDIRVLLEGSDTPVVEAAQDLGGVSYLEIGRLRYHSQDKPSKTEMTPLTPGRYQYHDGHLVWVGK
ncbi:MAG: hypothetical protein ACRYFX_05100 [Janthinobacterium lividum]